MSEKYQVSDKVIGRGSSSLVVEGFVRATNKRVIVKIIKDGGNGARNQKIVENEVRTMKSLLHPSIPTVMDSYFKDKDAYIVEDFIDGETLDSTMKKNSSASQGNAECIPISGVINLMFALISVLHYVHGSNIVHRDIKPANILISREGKVFLLDFGLGRRLDSASKSTFAGSFVGTELYAAPEIHARTLSGKEGESYLPRSDVWGVGAVLVHAICGVLFFDDVDFEETYWDDFERLKSGSHKGVEWGLQALLERTFDRNPCAQQLWEAVPESLKACINLCLTHDYRYLSLSSQLPLLAQPLIQCWITILL